MALRPANMKKCDKKCRCLFGVNEGKTYSCTNPCFGTYARFDPSKCDCGDGLGYNDIYVKWVTKRSGTGSYSNIEASNGGYTVPGWYNGSQRWSAHVGTGAGNRNNLYINRLTIGSTSCCAADSGPETWANGAIIMVSYRYNDDGDNYEACVWPEDCGVCSYSQGRDPGCITSTSTALVTADRRRDYYDEEANIIRSITDTFVLYYDIDPEAEAYDAGFYPLPDFVDPEDPSLPKMIDYRDRENVVFAFNSDCTCEPT